MNRNMEPTLKSIMLWKQRRVLSVWSGADRADRADHVVSLGRQAHALSRRQYHHRLGGTYV